MGKSKKKRKLRNKILKIVSNVAPYILSIGALYYTYRIDIRESKEILRIEHSGDYDVDQYFQLTSAYDDTRVEVKKRYKFRLQNNSNIDIIINKFKIIDNAPIGIQNGYSEYRIRNNNSYPRKKLPMVLQSLTSQNIYLDCTFIPNKEISDIILIGYLKNQNDTIISADHFMKSISKIYSHNTFYLKDSLMTLYEVDKSTPLIFQAITSKDNVFSLEFGYFDKYL